MDNHTCIDKIYVCLPRLGCMFTLIHPRMSVSSSKLGKRSYEYGLICLFVDIITQKEGGGNGLFIGILGGRWFVDDVDNVDEMLVRLCKKM